MRPRLVAGAAVLWLSAYGVPAEEPKPVTTDPGTSGPANAGKTAKEPTVELLCPRSAPRPVGHGCHLDREQQVERTVCRSGHGR